MPAVSELGFSIQRGERVGLIGENGAGKSTTLKMLTGIMMPTSGKLQVLAKVAEATFDYAGAIPDVDQTTIERNLNYIIKEHNARVMFFFRNTTFSAVRQDSKAVGIGLQIQM